MKIVFLGLTFFLGFLVSGCAQKHVINFKAFPERSAQMKDEAERTRTELNRYFNKEDGQAETDSIYIKAMNNEIHD